jgi:4'-phosphopantetheinyl transferase superfamily protein
LSSPVTSTPVREGIGIDIEDITAFDRFDEAAIRRASACRLSPDEQAWCACQPSAARALLVIFCCREAAFKCSPGTRAAHELVLRMTGGILTGRGTCANAVPFEIEVRWEVAGGRLLALAAGGDTVGLLTGLHRQLSVQMRGRSSPVGATHDQRASCKRSS